MAETELASSAAHTTSEAPAATTVQLSLEQRIEEFLAGVPIGSPGATGATSARGYDPTALIAVAVQLGLPEESAEVIYKQFVDARVAAAEAPTPVPDRLEPEPEPEPGQVRISDCAHSNLHTNLKSDRGRLVTTVMMRLRARWTSEGSASIFHRC